MNYIKWKIEEIKKYVSNSKPKTEPNTPIRLGVEKMTTTTYAGETAYENQQFILLNIYPKTNGTVSITYGGLTKTITDTSGAVSPNAQQVFFGTFNGVSDSVETPLSGELIIEGDYNTFTTGTYDKNDKFGSPGYYSGITNIFEGGNILEIPNYAFRNCTSLTSIEIPNSVTSIGNYAFYDCSSLESIVIPNSVTSIGEYTFGQCSNLANVYCKGTIEDWCNIQFKNNYQSNPMYYASHFYILNDNNEYYEPSEIVIPNTITSIGYYQFYQRNLTKLTISNSVTSINDYAFYKCSLTTVTLEKNSKLTSIGKEAFRECTNLTSIEIPNGVTSIGDMAFYDCSLQSSITIPNSVTSIGRSAFNYNSITTVYYNGIIEEWCNITLGGKVTAGTGTSLPFGSVDYIYILNDNNEYYEPSEIVIPDTETSIGDFQFARFNKLTSITIPNGVTSIGDGAFCECKKLADITIPDSVTSIGDGAFEYCIRLTSITIPNNVTSIGITPFSGIYNLTSITFINTSGWYVTETEGETSGTAVDVSNAANNVNLFDDYYRYYWYRS